MLNRFAISIIYIVLLTNSPWIHAQTKNGFDLTASLLPANEILQGGPPKDGIPAIHEPVFVNADQADYLNENDRILGIVVDNQAKAYPIRILNWHEVVNDSINQNHFSVTYCPLCGTGVAFKGTNKSVGIRFGVSGLLYNSDVLLYDLSTNSLWSQILGKAVTGERAGEILEKLPLQHTTWKDWLNQYPDSVVLSDETGFSRDYNRNPYEGYNQSTSIFFPTSQTAPSTYHPKELVIGLNVNNQALAFPFIELNQYTDTIISGELGGVAYTLNWNKRSQSAKVLDQNGNLIPAMQAFWFAWYTFHPDTDVFTSLSD